MITLEKKVPVTIGAYQITDSFGNTYIVGAQNAAEAVRGAYSTMGLSEEDLGEELTVVKLTEKACQKNKVSCDEGFKSVYSLLKSGFKENNKTPFHICCSD